MQASSNIPRFARDENALPKRRGAPSITHIFCQLVNNSPTLILPAIVNNGTIQQTPTITSPLGFTGSYGTAFSYQITASNSPTSYGASGLPTGLSVSASTGLITGTPTVTGTFYPTISASNSGGSGDATLTISITTPYDVWKSTCFSAAELLCSATSGDTACPAGDGISNFTKYALNLNPHVVGVGGLPVIGVTGTESSRYLTMSHTEVISAVDIAYVVEASSDLVTWSSNGISTTPVSGSLSSDCLTQKLLSQDSTPVTSATKRFLRLKIILP